MEIIGIVVIVAFIGFIVWRIRKNKTLPSDGGGGVPRNTPDQTQK